MKVSTKRGWLFLMVPYFLVWIGFVPVANGWEELPNPEEYIERMAKGEKPGWMPPTIEDLTGGKVKVGDRITKDNVDLVKDHITDSIYVCIKSGQMEMVMGKACPPEGFLGQFFWEATVKHKGMATMDEKDGIVYLKDGSFWPGGLPFLDPQTPMQAMANIKFGDRLKMSSNWLPMSPAWYVGKEGNLEKWANLEIRSENAVGRLLYPPIPQLTGYGTLKEKQISSFVDPREMRGLGQLTIKQYDDDKEPDSGFVYLPSFRRTIRVSSRTYQDNVGGMDFTFGDPQGLREPYSYWEFLSLQKNKWILCTSPDIPLSTMADGAVNPELKFTHGHTHPILEWGIFPMMIVEAKPVIKHIYGKKVFYHFQPPYVAGLEMVDIYDRQGQLWKCYYSYGHVTIKGKHLADWMELPRYKSMKEEIDNDLPYRSTWGIMVKDLQTGHHTMNPWSLVPNSQKFPMDTLNLTALLQMGK